MNLPVLINQIYGVFTFTGLYSFEFVDKNRNTITEIFFMMPPKTKSVSEGTRSSTIPTLSSNFNTDAGNSTKDISLSGELYFPYVGSPYNPVARDTRGMIGTIDGMTEFFKLRWMLIRYRDYTMSKYSRINVPITVLGFSHEIQALYRKVAIQLATQLGALYDEVKLIFHDYDMDDHFYCRVKEFRSEQSDSKYIAVSYNIELECYETDTMQKFSIVRQVKQKSNEGINSVNTQLQNLNFSVKFDSIQAEITYNSDFVSLNSSIENILSLINDENTKIQAGQSAPLLNIPSYNYQLLTVVNNALTYFITIFLSDADQILYNAGTLTIDEVVNSNLFSYYNLLQKLKLYATSLNGILNSIVKQDEIRYYSNADDYTLTTEQFDSGDENIVENNTTFYFYTVNEGDTARSIALHELKNQNKFISILKINKISENDFIDGTLIGQNIKIPIEENAITRSSENLVYESDPTDMDKFLYGIDLQTDINDRLMLSPKGDLLDCVGIENVYRNIEKRIQKRKGSLNVFNPNWGLYPVDDNNTPFLVRLDRYLSDIVNQIQSDPRVESVKMDLKKVKIQGESITTSSTVYFIGSTESREVAI